MKGDYYPYCASHGSRPHGRTVEQRGTDLLIPLADGYRTIVSPEDADLAHHCWQRNPAGYAMRTSKPLQTKLQLHRLVLTRKLGRELRPGYECDHVNGDRLDNRRDNLRELTHAQNTQNQGRGVRNTSGHVGVSFDRRRELWVAYINVARKRIQLGRYSTVDEAVDARTQAEGMYPGFWRQR